MLVAGGRARSLLARATPGRQCKMNFLPDGEALADTPAKQSLRRPAHPERAAPRWGAFPFSDRLRGRRAPNYRRALPPATIKRLPYGEENTPLQPVLPVMVH